MRSRILTTFLISTLLASSFPFAAMGADSSARRFAESTIVSGNSSGEHFVELTADFEQLFERTDRRSTNLQPIKGVHFAKIPYLDEIKSVEKMVRKKDWAGIRKWIKGKAAKGAVDFVLAYIVRKAFERQGYYCPEPPWWLPGKSIWFVSTCARYVS